MLCFAVFHAQKQTIGALTALRREERKINGNKLHFVIGRQKWIRPDDEAPPSPTLRLGNLPLSAKDKSLRERLEQLDGFVDVSIQPAQSTSTQTFAFADFTSPETASAALAELRRWRWTIDGSAVGAAISYIGNAVRPLPSTQLYVEGAFKTESELGKVFAAYQEQIASLAVVRARHNRIAGFVNFRSLDDSTRAIKELNGTHFRGRALALRYSASPLRRFVEA